MATQYTCSLKSIYHPHWLLQWSHPCSHMRIPVHSPWLPGYINVIQTILVVLMMAGLFLEQPQYIYTPTHKDFATSLTTRFWDLIILGLKNFIFSYNKVKFYTLQFIYFPLTYFLRIQIFDTLRHGLDILIKPTTKGAIVFFNLTLSHLSITLFFPIQEFPKPFPHSLSHWHEAQTPASIFWGPTNSKGDIVSASQTSQVGLKTTLWTMHELPNLTKMKLKEFYVQGHIDN